MIDVLLLINAKSEDGEVLCERSLQMPLIPRTGDVIAIEPRPSKDAITESNDDMWLDDYGFFVYMVKLNCNWKGVVQTAVCYVRIVDADVDEELRFGGNVLAEDEILASTKQLAAARWHVG